MKHLEDKIIRNVYVMETKKLSVSFVIKLVLALFCGAAALLMFQVWWEYINVSRTFDVLAIFSDDAEIIRSYLGDIGNVIFQETPKGLLLAIIIALAILLSLVLTFIFNFGKMRHKLAAIVHYWQHH